MEDILVSISCITFNHAKFIRKCFDGFLLQQTSFNYEVLVHDDASTDGTIDIINEYSRKHPHIFKPIIQELNQYSQGKTGFNAKYNFSRAKGKYIALCEGDDYWTHPHKLQEQVDFLEANPTYVMSFHDALVIHKNKNDKTETFGERFEILQNRSTFNHKDIVGGWFMPTASIIFKNGLITNYPEWAHKVYSGDYTLQLLISQYGLIKYHNKIWCTHLKHEGGISQRPDLELFRLNRRIYQYKQYIKYFDRKYKYDFSHVLLNFYRLKLLSKISLNESIQVRLKILTLRTIMQPLYFSQQYFASKIQMNSENDVNDKTNT